MDRLRIAVVGAMLGFFAVLVPSPAQAYPVLTCTISDVTVVGGEDATVTASIDPQVEADFELRYQRQVRTASGVSSITATFETSEVDEPTDTTVFATVTTQEGGSVPCAGGTIRLLPTDGGDDDDDDDDGSDGSDDGDNGGLLPNTGGERLAWLLIGGLLVLVGGGLVVASRRSRGST